MLKFVKRSHLQSDLLWHALSLIGEHHGVTVTAAFLACMLPQLELLQQNHFINHGFSTSGLYIC